MSAARALGAARARRIAAPLALLVTLAVAVAATVVLCAAPDHDLARVLPVEDGFYTLSVARELGTGGGLTIDGHVATDGFQPLWAFLVAPLAALVRGDRMATLRLALVLSSVLWLGFVALSAGLARAQARRLGLDGRLAGTLAAIVVAGSASFLRAFHNALETGLELVLLAGAALLLDTTRRWTAARAAALAALLAAVVYARLDAVVFVGAVALAALWRGWRDGSRRAVVLPWLACAVALLLLVPWLVRDVSIDGHVMPTSGRAEERVIDPMRNLDATLRALGGWALAPIFHPSLRLTARPTSELVAAAGLVLVTAAWWTLRRRAAPAGPGWIALGAYAGFLVYYYTWRFGSWWFEDRYEAPVALLFVPLLAAAAERRLPSRWARAAPAALATGVLAVNVPLLAVLVAAPAHPPWWASPKSNLATHANLNYDPQVTWTEAHVRPTCRMAGFESGTLGYFRDRVTNLDGKVDPAALAARAAGRTPAFVRAQGIAVLVDIPNGIQRATRGAPPGRWLEVRKLGRFEVWVRSDRRGCVD